MRNTCGGGVPRAELFQCLRVRGEDAGSVGRREQAAKDPELWKKPVDYLKARLPNAYLQPPVGVGNFGWLVDAGDPAYQDFLLEQAKRHIDKLPDTSGICIDRMNWLRLYNLRADDGVSWVDGRPARSLFRSWIGFAARLGPMMHDAGKVIFVNNHIKRLELLKDVDGIYCEHCYWGTALNATALQCVRRPAIGWTGIGTVGQRDSCGPTRTPSFNATCTWACIPRRRIRATITALPSAWADRQYLDYGPLLDAMRGKKWVLRPHVVTVVGNAAKVNLFEVPGGYALPVTFAGKATQVKVVLHGLDIADKAVCQALHPGRTHSRPRVREPVWARCRAGHSHGARLRYGNDICKRVSNPLISRS